MSFFGTKVPMERAGGGFVLLRDDDLLDNVVQFFFSTYSNEVGDTGECMWDHARGVPFELMRHRNVRSGMVERYVAIAHERFKRYASGYVTITMFERFYDMMNTVYTRWFWRNAKTRNEPEEPTNVEFTA